ncbi:TetR family transcriptional regulator [Leifsonia shinshuensis]|uniref:acyl-CoA-like ligand-binding transcription factor n=1 Tax=Leifsonia shinshuensis TaxID=150026 RepID=UPI002861DAB8|nr:TetR family transcriptional regulator [Leifsonia shinshuensis]MDR6972106.1 hypothetical protein [Leifsonia shinshuensis]
MLFAGSDLFKEAVLTAIAVAPPGASALDAAAAGFEAAAGFIQNQPDPDFPRRRAAVIAANPSLQERELLKLSTVGSAAARALQDRGVDPVEASIAAQAALAAFHLAFERWVSSDEPLDLPALVRDGIARIRALR